MRWAKRQRRCGTDSLQGIPLTALRHAVVVAEVLNFHHAANILGTTQSCVSARIKALEEALGILLFERRHRGVRLTEAGRRFIVDVSAGIAQLDHAVRTAGAVSSGSTGQLAIGFVSSIVGDFLCGLRSRFRETYPDVEQVVMEGSSAKTIALVRDGKLDVALVLDPADAPDCHSRLLWSEPYRIALDITHPMAESDAITWAHLASETFLLPVAGAGPQLFEHVVRRMAERGNSPRVRRCDVGHDTLMHMVASGEGITLAIESARYMSGSAMLRSIADETEQARFRAIWSPHNRSAALKNLLDLADQMEKSVRSA